MLKRFFLFTQVFAAAATVALVSPATVSAQAVVYQVTNFQVLWKTNP